MKAGETFGAAYVVGWFDDVAEMEKVYDQYKGAKTVDIKDGQGRREVDRRKCGRVWPALPL